MIILLAVLVLAALSICVLIGAAFTSRDVVVLRTVLATQALLAGGASVYLAFYVAGEDDYRDNGITRWDAYDAQGLTVAAVSTGLIVALLALILVGWPRRRLLPLLGLAGIIAAALIFVAFFANTLN